MPELIATRAFALAALDRAAEANAEMTVVVEDYPTYVLMSTAQPRIRLTLAVHAGDLEAASRVALTRTSDMPLTLRDDMLADVVLAATTPMPDDKRERIEAELSEDPELRAWIDGVAPGMRQRSRARVATDKRVITSAPGELIEDEAHEQPARASALVAR